MTDDISNFMLERYAVGDTDAATTARIAARLTADPALRERLVVINARCAEQDAAFGDAMPRVFAAPNNAVAWHVKWRQAWTASSVRPLAFAAMAACALFVVWPQANTTEVEAPTQRQKGGVRSSFVVADASGVHQGHDGATLRPGDKLQWLLLPPDDGAWNFALVGTDATEKPSVYWSGSVTTETPRPMRTDAALVLDDVLGTERFFVVWGKDAASVLAAQAMTALENGKAPQAGTNVEVETFTLAKVPAP